jgi:hypothetical protein
MARRFSAKYLPESDIEAEALCTLAEYGRKFGEVARPPVPVEQILEAHLQLTLEVDDLPAVVGTVGVLGATYVQDRRVVIDQSLDPSEFPAMLGRYRFTVAHEVGHWALHRHAFLENPAQGRLFDERGQPSIVCRSGSKERAEWQADCFAGHLLMPKAMVFEVWREQHGSLQPYIAVDEIADLNARWGLAEDMRPTVKAAREIARVFDVSGQAMQIRLMGLGLVRTKAPEPDLFSVFQK